MNVYYYRLLLSSGRVRSGITQLSVERDASARMWLEKNFDAVVLSLYRLPGWLAETQRSISHLVKPSIRPVELAGMLRDLAVMTSSGIPVLEALRARREHPSELVREHVAWALARHHEKGPH